MPHRTSRVVWAMGTFRSFLSSIALTTATVSHAQARFYLSRIKYCFLTWYHSDLVSENGRCFEDTILNQTTNEKSDCGW